MDKNSLDEYFLEIKALQKADYDRAIESGYTTKKDWYDYIITQEEDNIANAIISISNRYNIPLYRVANDFDSSMIMRVGKIYKNNTKIKK